MKLERGKWYITDRTPYKWIVKFYDIKDNQSCQSTRYYYTEIYFWNPQLGKWFYTNKTDYCTDIDPIEVDIVLWKVENL